jgi:hypothetical protein
MYNAGTIAKDTGKLKCILLSDGAAACLTGQTRWQTAVENSTFDVQIR